MKALIPGQPCAKSRVLKVQKILLLEETGAYDSVTVNGVREFQKNQKLKVDGEAGPKTWDSMVAFAEGTGRGDQVFVRLPLVKVVLPGAAEIAARNPDLTYTSVRMRQDAAEAMAALAGQVAAFGGAMTTAGADRALTAPVTAGRVPMSGHYLAVDFDLGTYTLMVDPDQDLFVVTRTPQLDDRRWNVWMRVSKGVEARELSAVVWGRRGTVKIRGYFIDFTALASLYGFFGVSCHAGSWWEDGAQLPSGGRSGLESWHFSWREGMEPGETTFGDELLRVYPLSKMVGTPPWEQRHAVYRKEWF